MSTSIALRTCKDCHETKPVTDFNKAKNKPGKIYYDRACRKCYNARRQERGLSTLKRKAETREERQIRRLWEDYRITPEQYEALAEAQGHVCAMCEQPPPDGTKLHIDHCHTTRVVRALLCKRCNIAVGFFEKHGAAISEYLAAYGDGNPLLNQAPGSTRGGWPVRREPLTPIQGPSSSPANQETPS